MADLEVPEHLRRTSQKTEAAWLDSARAILALLAAATGRADLGSCSVLDIGCGTKLTKVLVDERVPIGRYVGLDANREVIEFLGAHASGERFSYHHLDAHNEMYNPDGVPMASFDRLPTGDETFDIISLWSVFTHLAPGDLGEMLRLARQSVAPDGHLVGSIYLNECSSTGVGFVDVVVRRTLAGDAKYGGLARLRTDVGDLALPKALVAGARNDNEAVDRTQKVLGALLDAEPQTASRVGDLVDGPDPWLAALATAALRNLLRSGDPEQAADLASQLVDSDPRLRAVLDELPADAVAVDPFGLEPGPTAPGEPLPFVDWFPNSPLRVAVYARSLVQRLVDENGWRLESVVRPSPAHQHVLVLRPR